ncbi:Pdp3-interacting factor 1 [Trichophyton interdigitale]|uniref:Pdp3-interacting factor 1 n=1 Tax=Trichophyton interdigitale TaxID=101480 RepID=A0A9P4YF93_9EURO|nr:Pdp3-interacting factor 1 [Trichophyton interdigitale]KAF3894934.1 Pdp3-interacting factor 1 [Trichophyton interdigitale]KAG8209536.1 Pdp3-interacting factor 1 [Trichophyton interdigitale]
MGSLDSLPAMKSEPKIIFFTDFDGTITLQDSNDHLTDHLGFGAVERSARNTAILKGKITFRDGFREMLDSIDTPFDECVEFLCQRVTLDPHFTEFYNWAKNNNVPVVVLSSGMVPIIHALLVKLLGHEPENIQIVANQVTSRDGKDINSKGGWQIDFHDDSHFGHDKSLEIRPYAAIPKSDRPILLYAGDGVSDISAARQTDLLFAKKGHDLTIICKRDNIPYTTFEDWSSILSTTRDLLEGKTTLDDVIAAQKHDNK